MRDQGARYFRKTRSYQSLLTNVRSVRRVMTAAARGIPRKTATLVATTWYEIGTPLVDLEMTLTNKIASGAYSTI